MQPESKPEENFSPLKTLAAGANDCIAKAAAALENITGEQFAALPRELRRDCKKLLSAAVFAAARTKGLLTGQSRQSQRAAREAVNDFAGSQLPEDDVPYWETRAAQKDSVTLIRQLLNIIPRDEFQSLVEKHGTEKRAKGFSSFVHFIVMVAAQLLGIDSLRDLAGATACSKERSLELRLEGCEPKKSALADANNKRNWELFRDAFLLTLEKIKTISRAPDFDLKIKQQMYAIDSAVISLCTKVFEFAKYRHSKGGIKVHTSINVSEGPLPEFIEVTEGKAAGIRSAGLLLERIPAGSVITMDRGYIDYDTLYQINESNKFFVTRTKDEMKFTAAKDPSDTSEENDKEEAELKAEEEAAEESFYDETKKTTFNVIRDEKVNPANKESFKAYPTPLRIVTIKDDKSGGEVEFLTNIMKGKAAVIAAVYKKRWEIENFFKTIKQHFHIKGFMGTSYNAVCCQIWAALTATILIKYLIRVSSVKWNFSNLINLFRSAGFICRRLSEWINISHCEPGADDQIPERRRKSVQQTGSLPFRS